MSMDKLLIKVYKVRFGDLIFMRIPDNDHLVHILIDCGGRRIDDIERAIDDIVDLLNAEDIPQAERGKLDLLVLTHNHYDHIKGFESETIVELLTQDVTVERVWITVAMQEDHAGSNQLRALQEHVNRTLRVLSQDPTLHWNDDVGEFFEILRYKDDAQEAIREKFTDPLYVYRGVEDDLSDADQAKYLLQFDEASTALHILAPEENVDESYLGHAFGLVEPFEEGESPFTYLVPKDQRGELPKNIPADRFNQLKSQILETALFAASQSNGFVNNTSVVLLLEWRGLRFLFPGDAEHKSWKLMWQHAQQQLSQEVNFLKVAHHGSHNGTPYDVINTDDPDTELNEILDAILPESNATAAYAVVSTFPSYLSNVNEIPKAETMRELAKRITNKRQYEPVEGEELTSDDWQPQRTDKEIDDKIEFLFPVAD